MRLNKRLVVALSALGVAASSVGLAGEGGQPRDRATGLTGRNAFRTLGGQLKPYPSQYYDIYTDLTGDEVKEAQLRMTRMAEEYHDRTAALFRGRINGKLPFFLYAKPPDYYKAGGMQGSAGVFDGEALMAMTVRDRSGNIYPQTWHTVQYEGFHQFVKSVIRGEIPIWANEGLAEYFGESLFTGDGMVTGLIPAGRLQRLKKTIASPDFKGIRTMMEMSHEEWNAAFSARGADGPGSNYDTAWAMVHFMAHAENGKYQGAFSGFLVQIGSGKNWEKAWALNFGSDAGFEEKWKEYWLKMPDNPTADLYAKAAVSTFTSFVGRAAAQKQTFENFEQFMATEAKDVKAAPADWLPPALLAEMKGLVEPLKKEGCVFTLTQAKGKPTTVQCVMADGSKYTGTPGAGNKAKVDFAKAPPAKTPAKPR
jgi:hypothetical protein